MEGTVPLTKSGQLAFRGIQGEGAESLLALVI
jgi:hypothetical protein